MRALIFLGLKAVEISAIVFVPYWFSFLWLYVTGLVPDNGLVGLWLIGAFTIVICGTVGFVLGSLIISNWKWSKKLATRIKEGK
jgi:hypothetical protein